MDVYDLQKALKKKYGDNSMITFDDLPPLEVVDTGSLMLDYVSGVGGMPKGLNLVYQGLPGSGKTFLALLNILSFQKLVPDMNVGFVDVENRLNKQRVLELGIDPKRFFITRNAKAEHVFDILSEYVRAKNFGLVVTDSISNISSKQEIEGSMEDANNPGNQSKAIQKGYRKLTSEMMDHNSKQINVFICQMMAKIGAQKWESKTDVKGGNGPKYMSSFSVEVTAVQGKDGTEVDSGGNVLRRDVRLNCVKNSISNRPFRKGLITIDFKKGIYKPTELYDLGKGFGHLIQSGPYISFKDQRFRGYESIISEMENNFLFSNELESVIKADILAGKDTCVGDKELVVE